jgi:hypothetical protein
MSSVGSLNWRPSEEMTKILENRPLLIVFSQFNRIFMQQQGKDRNEEVVQKHILELPVVWGGPKGSFRFE